MNNVLVYCELSEKNAIADISLELCTKGRQLATKLGCRLQAAVLGSNVKAAADYVTLTCEEDGIIHALRHFEVL